MSLNFRKKAAGLTFALLLGCSAWAQEAAKQPEYVDRAEYDLVQSIQNEKDNNKKLDLLKQWKEKYPNSAFKEQRYNFMVVTYQAKGDAQGMYDTAKEMAVTNPKGFGNYWLTILTTSLAKNDEGFLSTGEQAANGLITALNEPGSIFPAAQKAEFETAAHKTLGWVNMTRKNWEPAEAEFTKVLQANPNDAETAYFMGVSVLSERKKEKTSQALYYLAHALGVSGNGALQPAARPQVQQYLEKAYTTWHGKKDGYDKLLADAKASAIPPADFHIESGVEAATKEVNDYNEKMKNNPSLAQWNGMKDLLNTPDGQSKFPTDIKGASIPTKFSGKLISADPAAAPKRLILSVSDGTTPDATLELSAALKCQPEAGATVGFEGSPEAFTPNPYMLTMNVDTKKLTGLAPACTAGGAAPVRRPAARPATRKK